MSLARAAIAAIVILLTAAGWWWFPGHTYLIQDTQIYQPILDRLSDRSLFENDPVALRPHVTYTIYDETARGLRRLTGLSFRDVLYFQQLVTRALGIFGMFLLARAASLDARASLVVAAIFGLGATIAGPSVLTFEYEPVPRGYAIQLLVLGLGLAAHARWAAAGVAVGCAFLYHPPTTIPVVAVFGLRSLWRRRERREALRLWLPVAAAAAVGWVVAQFQAGESEPQRFLGVIDQELETMQRLRGAYNWVSLWPAGVIRQHEFLWLVSVAACARLGRRLTEPLRWAGVGLPLVGLVAMPLSLLLLEGLKWSLMTQIQPGRTTLFIVLMAQALAAMCGATAARAGKWWESVAWFVPAFAIPMQAEVLPVLLPDWREALSARRFLVALVLSLVAHFALRNWGARPRLALVSWLAALALPIFAIPVVARVQNYRQIDHPEIHTLADWARRNTTPNAVFLFPDAGRELYPGQFRVYAKRALYVDWKGGGQVNLLKEFARQWWQRWQQTGAGSWKPELVPGFGALGIDYLVVKAEHRLPGRAPEYENARYVAYRLR